MRTEFEFWRDSDDASDIRLKNHVSPVQVRLSAQNIFLGVLVSPVQVRPFGTEPFSEDSWMSAPEDQVTRIVNHLPMRPGQTRLPVQSSRAISWCPYTDTIRRVNADERFPRWATIT